MGNHSKRYNGHKNWAHWNVSLWINNDEGLYGVAQRAIACKRTKTEAAQYVLDTLIDDMGITKTPDGAPYSVSAIRAAMEGM